MEAPRDASERLANPRAVHAAAERARRVITSSLDIRSFAPREEQGDRIGDRPGRFVRAAASLLETLCSLLDHGSQAVEVRAMALVLLRDGHAEPLGNVIDLLLVHVVREEDPLVL